VTTRLVIVGCGGFGREVFSLVAAINQARGSLWTVEGFVDDSPSAEDRARVSALGSCLLGPVESLRHWSDISSVIAIGCPSVRTTVAGKLDGLSVHFPPLVHPAATVGSAVALGRGVVIAAGARLSTNIRLGAHVQIDQNVTIGHDTQVGDYSRLNPQACVSGSVQIGTGVLIGANATILPALRVGSGATVGAQACVVHDVAEHTVVKGVPAR
jgi:sugar O-acyltransferase (sialic acid O-acetyltransferase NeuD family)